MDSRYRYWGRITPAYAGNTELIGFSFSPSQDHPRIRGKHTSKSSMWFCGRGSPPAYAGNTYLIFEPVAEAKDHPRIRGKHSSGLSQRCDYRGSPPHTRETRVQDRIKSDASGITPAYAGNTSLITSANCIAGDHPRIRGKHEIHSASSHEVSGSPPHTRETPNGNSDFSSMLGITPAYAGNTLR